MDGRIPGRITANNVISNVTELLSFVLTQYHSLFPPQKPGLPPRPTVTPPENNSILVGKSILSISLSFSFYLSLFLYFSLSLSPSLSLPLSLIGFSTTACLISVSKCVKWIYNKITTPDKLTTRKQHDGRPLQLPPWGMGYHTISPPTLPIFSPPTLTHL